MLRTFILYFGYAEDLRPAPLILEHATGFQSVDDAAKSLHDCFVTAIKDTRGCEECRSNKLLDSFPHYSFCPQCGWRIVPGFPLVEDLEAEAFGLLEDYTSEVWEILNQEGWSCPTFIGSNPFSKPEEVVIVNHSSEELISIGGVAGLGVEMFTLDTAVERSE